jgi:nicotinamide mononucleotide transporter
VISTDEKQTIQGLLFYLCLHKRSNLSIPEMFRHLVQNIQDTKWPEWVSTVTQIASVWYARKNNVLVYPTGIIGVLLAAYVYFFMTHPPLYADASLNIYYFLMSVYGWYNWVRKKDAGHYTYPISWCTKKELSIGIGFFIVFWIVIYFVLKGLTDSNTPVLDSLVSASAITAMWWMAKRKIENWLAWIFSNIIAIPLNFYKELMLFTLMYVLFLLMAWWGYVEWKKKSIEQGMRKE